MGQTGVRVQILASPARLVATGVGPDRALLPTGAPNYTMYVPSPSLLADLRAGLTGQPR
jgi:hypothetical protein